MSLIRTLCFFFPLVFLSSILCGQEEKGESDKISAETDLIRATLTDYIEGSTNGQPDRLRKAFHKDLNLYSIKNGAVSVWSGKDYINDTKQGKPTGESGKILSIDFENDAAVAKVEISHPNSRQPYVDYFMLLKVKGRWTIIHKMYTRKVSRVKEGPKNDAPKNDKKDNEKGSSNLVGAFKQNVSSAIEKEIDELFAEYSGSNSPGAAIAIIQNGEVVFKKGYGNANLEHRIPIDPDASVFNAASVSKQVTAFSILLLAEQGKLSLDDSIHKIIPELNGFGQKVTLRQLVHHTGGIRSDLSLLAMAGWSPGDNIGRDDVLQMIYRQKELNFEPGEEFDYSNSGYDLLAEVVARVSGQSFAEFCSENVFQPLEMNNSFFISNRSNLIPNLASPYGSNQSRNWRLNSNDSYSGSTGLFTTVADLSKWTLNYRNSKVGSDASLKQSNTMGTLNNGKKCGYAFGQFIEEYKGLKHIQHGGASSAYRSYIGRFPEHDFATVLLSNNSSVDPRGKSLELAEIFLRKHFNGDHSVVNHVVENLTVEQMEKFTGNYLNERNQSVRIHIQEGGLVFSIGGGPRIELKSLGGSDFEMLGIGSLRIVRFMKNGQDKFSMQEVVDGGVVDTYQTYVPKQYTSEDLKLYAGTYYSQELDTKYRVEVENGSLLVKHLRFPANRLVPVVTDVFSNQSWRFTTLKFERNDDNTVDGFRISSMRCRNIHFNKLDDDLAPSFKRSLADSVLEMINQSGIKQGLKFFEENQFSSEYYVRESELNEAGYELLNQDRTDDAIEIFKLNVSLFPASWNVFDSLGEAYAKIGDVDQAIANYKKSIQLNSDNSTGVATLKKLEQKSVNKKH